MTNQDAIEFNEVCLREAQQGIIAQMISIMEALTGHLDRFETMQGKEYHRHHHNLR